MSRPVIALLTDFGVSDPYAGVMKGVILSRAPEAQIVDLTHEVPPHAVVQGAFLLEGAWCYFPPGTTFLVVVDPGVGSERRRVAIEAGGMRFVGPDNGVLSAALPEELRGLRDRNDLYEVRSVRLDRSITAVSIENQALLRQPVSATFEGRDVFAPAAAFLATGGGFAELGPRFEVLQALPAFRAPRDGNKLRGRIVHIDTFGNLITDIRAQDLDGTTRFKIGNTEVPLVRTYAEGRTEQEIALVGSSAFVEVAIANGSAADLTGAAVGARVEEV